MSKDTRVSKMAAPATPATPISPKPTVVWDGWPMTTSKIPPPPPRDVKSGASTKSK